MLSKVSSKEVEIKLIKESFEEITINCPKSIKLKLLDLYTALRLDIPPLHVKPRNYITIILHLLLYLSMFLIPFTIIYYGIEYDMSSNIPFIMAIIIGIILLIINIIVAKNYYWNIIHKKLQQGYKPANDESKSILKNAKINF